MIGGRGQSAHYHGGWVPVPGLGGRLGLMDDAGADFVPEINAITLTTSDMEAAVAFYQVAAMTVIFGGDKTSPFTSLRFGSNFVNLTAGEGEHQGFWGRVIFHVESPDAVWAAFVEAGFEPDFEPRDAPWGERYFHILDPDGHELSFARRLD